MTFRSRTLYQLSDNGQTLKPPSNRSGTVTFRSRTLYQLSYNGPSTTVYETLWWTGKDSNLRNAQGVTDLQSVGFNHSPTRPDRAPTVLPP